MISLLTKLKRIRKYQIISSLACVSLVLTGCQTQNTKSNLSNDSLFGTYNSKSVKFSELTPGEKSEIINAQKKVYDTAQSILEKYYLDSWFVEYQAKNKLANLEDARKDYFSKNVKVLDEDIQKFIKQNSANPQMQQIPEKERSSLVKQYLTRLEQAKAEQAILQKAEEEGKISLVGIEKPVDLIVNFTSGGYKYDSNLKEPKITIVEFADYQCPYCVQAHETIEKILSSYKGKVQYIFRDFPLTEIHPQAMPAAIAAKCASSQGKYWEMHKLLFNRSPMAALSTDMYTKFATQLDLNLNDFKSCQEDKGQTISKSILADMEEGNNIGVNATPSIFINGQKYEGNLSFEGIKKEIDERLALK
jgi:protein-disulfide isomerase